MKPNWKTIKALLDEGFKPIEIEHQLNGLVTASQIYRKRAQWSKQAYYSKNPKYAKYHTPEYKAWRSAVLKRDKEKCVVCGRGRPARLQVDHIQAWCNNVELRFDVSNGRVLCIPCHKRTPNYGRKARSYIYTAEKDAEWIRSERERVQLAKIKRRLKELNGKTKS